MLSQGDGSAVMAVEDMSREKAASYRDYIDLWSYLMDPSEIKVSDERFVQIVRMLACIVRYAWVGPIKECCLKIN